MPTPRARPIAWRSFLGLAAIVLLTLLAIAIYPVTQRIAAGNQLRDTKRDLTAAGLLKPLAELAPPPSREAVANGEKFLAAIEGISALTRADYDITGGPEIMLMSAPGVAIAASLGPTPIFPSSKNTAPPATWDDLRLRLTPALPILAAARPLLQTPTSYDRDYCTLKSITPAEHPQALVAWLRASAILNIHAGNIPAAIDDIQAISQSAAFLSSRPSITSYVLSAGLWHFGLNGLFWEILQSPSLTEADLIRLDKIVRAAPSPSDALLCLETDLSSTPYWIDELKDGPPQGRLWNFSQPGHGLLSTSLADDIREALWRHVWVDQDEALTLAEWGRSIEYARRIITNKNWHAVPETAFEQAPAPIVAAWRFPYYNVSESSSTTQGLIKFAVKFEATRQLILTAIALQRYHLRHGRYPDTLAALVPDYLPELPNDWYDGQPLKYRYPDTTNVYLLLDPPETYLLYSIGPDGIDQGGDPTPAEETAPRPTMTTGRDIVWPRREQPRP